MISRGFGLYDETGRILFACSWKPLIDLRGVIGTIVWDHFAAPSRFDVKAAFIETLTRCQWSNVRCPMEPSIYGKQVCSVRFMPTGVETAPVAGMFSAIALSVVELGRDEVLVARLLPTHTAKEIACILGVSRRTIERIKLRLAAALEVPRHDLIRTVATLHDLL
jgi:hypothetical protein